MPKRSEFIEYLLEMLHPLGELRPKAMFGGWGLYANDLFFALIIDDTLYLKVDDENCADFEVRGLQPFQYESDGKIKTMRYCPPPAEALDDRELLCTWARKGLQAATRAATKRPPKPRPEKRRREPRPHPKSRKTKR